MKCIRTDGKYHNQTLLTLMRAKFEHKSVCKTVTRAKFKHKSKHKFVKMYKSNL